ncbi:uncharacterized protein LOC126213066 isoform X1 [Schistocerca nitens]|uniref:uncharacterized protein LOC126213066 isoform X1 n=1 Tax=Schistocerca nitens TaxID=7011 RepID=UPI0021177F85|nr:uncharacterized protein LOC126213066 isoform X1 [Schistocerca nitens]
MTCCEEQFAYAVISVMYFVTDWKRRTVKFKHSLYCRIEAMDQDPTMWIKKEETDEVKTELHSMADKIFQYSVLTTRGNICPVRARHLEDGCKQGSGLPIQHEEGVNKEFLEDPLKTEGPSVSVKQDPELKQHADGSEHNVSFHTSTLLCRKCSKNVVTQIWGIQAKLSWMVCNCNL